MFLDYGFDGSTLRMVTTHAAANIASANYHFGGKDQLFTAMLARRFDPMNAARRTLLASREAANAGRALSTETILAAMFVPALALARESRGATQAVDFLRLLGRAYVDPSPVVRNFLSERYSGTIGSFKDAFARALPHLSRQELSWRLHFTLGALSYTLAGGDAWKLIDTIQGNASDDERLLARLTPFLIAGLQAPVPDLGATLHELVTT
jgi:AcrR family transcriptional regulator